MIHFTSCLPWIEGVDLTTIRVCHGIIKTEIPEYSKRYKINNRICCIKSTVQFNMFMSLLHSNTSAHAEVPRLLNHYWFYIDSPNDKVLLQK